MKHGTTHKTTKGYLRITAGPLRNEYVHRVVAAAWLGRELKKDEQVHHRNKDKLDPRHWNLLILGQSDHSWVSAKQAYFMSHIKEPEDKREWDEFINEQATIQAQQIATARPSSIIIRDGELQKAWERDHG